MSKYVQHISGQGGKFEVWRECKNVWNALQCESSELYDLPKSEYREVPAPEVWVDVTEACEGGPATKDSHTEISHKHDGGYSLFAIIRRDNYRLRKVQLSGRGCKYDCCKECWKDQWAFIVEKKL